MTTDLNPFEGLTGGVLASSIEQTDKIKAAIIGLPKSGKSWFAATAPGSKRHYDFDDRAISLAKLPESIKKDLSVITLVDKSQKNPTVMKELETELSMLQYRKAKGLSIPDTYIFDTVTYLKKGIQNEIWAQDPKLAREIKVGSASTVRMGKTYDTINGVQGYMEYLVTEFSRLGNLIVVFHEKDEKDKAESTPEQVRYTGRITVDPQYLSNILTLFNEVFRITVDFKGQYSVRTAPDQNVIASTTLLVDADEPPNIMDMIAKHKLNKIKLNRGEK